MENDEKLDNGGQAETLGRPILLFLGFALLGVTLVFLLFGEDLFRGQFFGQEQSVLEQVPASGGTAVVAQQSEVDERPAAP